jgi:hypothetical protein
MCRSFCAVRWHIAHPKSEPAAFIQRHRGGLREMYRVSATRQSDQFEPSISSALAMYDVETPPRRKGLHATNDAARKLTHADLHNERAELEQALNLTENARS